MNETPRTGAVDSALVRASPFLDPNAVDIWDADFRWRDGDVLRDVSIDSTWERMAKLLASADRRLQPPHYERDLIDAFASWRVLLDERVIARAGTGRLWPREGLCAVVNVGAFVRAPLSSRASLDLNALESSAALAVCALDDATILADARAEMVGLRVGLIGFADALALLGIHYDGPAARSLARQVARSLAEASFAESIALSAERGTALGDCTNAIRRARAHDFARHLISDAERHGVRHRSLTAIEPHPRLAQLANGASDAIDPLRPLVPSRTAPSGSSYANPSIGYARLIARDLARVGRSTFVMEPPRPPSVAAQIAIRGAMQPWIDEPIDYPAPVFVHGEATDRALWDALAAAQGLAPVRTIEV